MSRVNAPLTFDPFFDAGPGDAQPQGMHRWQGNPKEKNK